MTESAARLDLIDQRVRSLGPDVPLAYVLWLFFGWAGIHRFYLGRPLSAIFQIISCVLVVGLLWWWADGFLIPWMVAKTRRKLREQLLADPRIDIRPGVVEAIGFNGRMTLERDRLTISRERRSAYAGFVTFETIGVQGPKVIPVWNITAVELREPDFFLRGYIRLSINGRDPVGGISEAARDPNAILFSKYDTASFQTLRDALQNRIQAIGAHEHLGEPIQATTSQYFAAGSQADEIAKLADLRDKGILTPEEFEAKKEQILAS